MLTIFANLARIPAANPHREGHPPHYHANPRMRLFSFSKTPKQSNSEPDESRASLLASRSPDHQSGELLDTPATSTNRDTQGFRNISPLHTATDIRGQRRVTTVSIPGSRLTSDVIGQISAAVLRQHRAFTNLSPESRARLPRHLHRMRAISGFEPADDIDLDSVAELRYIEIPIILTTFHTGTEEPHSTGPAKSNISPTSDTQLSEYSWLDLEQSDGEENANPTPGPEVGGKRRLPGRVVSTTALAKKNEMRPSLPIAAGFACPRGPGLEQASNTDELKSGMKIENPNAESPVASFKVFPRNAIPPRGPQTTPQLLPVPHQFGPVRDWLNGVPPGRSGETPSTSESERTHSLETTSTANTREPSRQQTVQDRIPNYPMDRQRPVARTSNANRLPGSSQTQPRAPTRFSKPPPRLSTIVDVSPPHEQDRETQVPPARYRRRR